MCPVCLSTAAMIAAGASSTGGLGALVLRTLRGKGDAGNAEGSGAADLPHPSEHYDDNAAILETER
jgi:hypothetical protein